MKTRTMLFSLAVGAVFLAVGAPAQGKKPPVKFSAALNIGQERPIPKGAKAGASGRFTATYVAATGILTWRLTFSHLSGDATAAHIHMGGRRVNGPVVFPLCGPCTSPTTGSIALTTAQLNDLKARKMYVNVHTGKNPNGEIRGQITRAPV